MVKAKKLMLNIWLYYYTNANILLKILKALKANA